MYNAAMTIPALGPSSPPEIWKMTQWGPAPSPATLRRSRGIEHICNVRLSFMHLLASH